MSCCRAFLMSLTHSTGTQHTSLERLSKQQMRGSVTPNKEPPITKTLHFFGGTSIDAVPWLALLPPHLLLPVFSTCFSGHEFGILSRSSSLSSLRSSNLLLRDTAEDPAGVGGTVDVGGRCLLLQGGKGRESSPFTLMGFLDLCPAGELLDCLFPLAGT